MRTPSKMPPPGVKIGKGGHLSSGYVRIAWKDPITGKLRAMTKHTYLWRLHFGDVPKNHVIHHKDGNRTNNDLSNLQCLSRPEHVRLHQTLYSSDEERKAAKAKRVMKKYYANVEVSRQKVKLRARKWRSFLKEHGNEHLLEEQRAKERAYYRLRVERMKANGTYDEWMRKHVDSRREYNRTYKRPPMV